MKQILIPEPKLFFAGNESSIDPKVGLLNFGPYGSPVDTNEPCSLRAGVIATKKSLLELEHWLERLKTRISAETNLNTNVPEPDFPGISLQSPFRFEIKIDQSCIENIPEQDIDALEGLPRKQRIVKVLGIYAQKFKDLEAASDPKPPIVLLPLSQKLLNMCRDPNFKGQKIVYERRTFDKRKIQTDVPLFDFHNALKVLAFQNGGFTTQVIRPATMSFGRGTQDTATIGWNFAVSTYYKATGIPWKLSDIDDETCYVGISFYQELSSGERIMRACMAQVYLRTGESQVIRGKPFKSEADGLSPRLTEQLAEDIIRDVIELYKRQKDGRMPKRIVIHKSSPFSEAEIAGFNKATKGIEMADFVHINRKSGIMMLPEGQQYPAIRGTFIYEGSQFLLYTTGFVPAIGTFNGSSVPAPLLMRAFRMDTTPEIIAKDILALTKLDWNNAYFNTRTPVTISVSEKVGEILSESSAQGIVMPSHYKYYM